MEKLTRKLGTTEKESEEKAEEIEKLKGEISQGVTKTRLLEEDLLRVRDENVQIKNRNKVVCDSDIDNIYKELQDFKRDVKKQIKDLNQELSKKREEESVSSGQRKETTSEDQQRVQEEEHQLQQEQQRSLQQQLALDTPNTNYQWNANQHQPTLGKNLVPGSKLYSKSHLRTTMIITDSMAGRVNIKQVNRNIDTNEEEVVFKRFPGHTADELSFYAPKPLHDTKPNQVVIIAGTNDIGREVDSGRVVNEHEVVENILKIGRIARDTGAEKIFVSSIIVRHGYQYKSAVKRFSNLLESACSSEGFWFLDQSDITSSHIGYDGVHLNFHGQTLLKMSILSCFNTFNPYFTDFGYDYENSLF